MSGVWRAVDHEAKEELIMTFLILITDTVPHLVLGLPIIIICLTPITIRVSTEVRQAKPGASGENIKHQHLIIESPSPKSELSSKSSP